MGARLEYHADADAVDDAAEDGRQQLLLQLGALHHARLKKGVVAIGGVDKPHEQGNGEGADKRLDAEHAAEEINAQQQQGHVHAESGDFRLPSPQVVEHHREAVRASRRESVRLGEKHGSERENETAAQQPGVADEKVFRERFLGRLEEILPELLREYFRCCGSHITF